MYPPTISLFRESGIRPFSLTCCWSCCFLHRQSRWLVTPNNSCNVYTRLFWTPGPTCLLNPFRTCLLMCVVCVIEPAYTGIGAHHWMDYSLSIFFAVNYVQHIPWPRGSNLDRITRESRRSSELMLHTLSQLIWKLCWNDVKTTQKWRPTGLLRSSSRWSKIRSIFHGKTGAYML